MGGLKTCLPAPRVNAHWKTCLLVPTVGCGARIQSNHMRVYWPSSSIHCYTLLIPQDELIIFMRRLLNTLLPGRSLEPRVLAAESLGWMWGWAAGCGAHKKIQGGLWQTVQVNLEFGRAGKKVRNTDKNTVLRQKLGGQDCQREWPIHVLEGSFGPWQGLKEVGKY